MKSEIKEKISVLAAKGVTEARFAFEPNAKLFAGLLAAKGLEAKIYKMLGHATTVETIHKRLHHHFLVTGDSAATKVLKKFV